LKNCKQQFNENYLSGYFDLVFKYLNKKNIRRFIDKTMPKITADKASTLFPLSIIYSIRNVSTIKASALKKNNMVYNIFIF
jgi:hypothetical protein